MLHPYQIETLGKLRYQHLLQEGDVERRLRQIQGTSPQLAQRAGDLLVALGQKLGGGQQPVPHQPALRLK